MFGDLVQRIFKTPPSARADGGGHDDDGDKQQPKQQSSTCCEAKVKLLYWLLGLLAACVIVVDGCLLVYVNQMTNGAARHQLVRWTALDEEGRAEVRLIARTVMREELLLERRRSDGDDEDNDGGDGEEDEFPYGYQDDRYIIYCDVG